MRLKIAENVPEPRELTPDDWRRIEEESEDWRRAFEKATRKMEQLTAEDLLVRVR